MSIHRIASRYAKSLIDLSGEQGKLERVIDDIQHFQQVCGVRDFYLLLKSPIVNISKKSKIFHKLFDGVYDSLTMSFLDIILRKGREAYLPEIADEFVEQYRDIKQIAVVELTTAAPLTAEQLEQFRQAIAASGVTYPNIELAATVDPDILGGFVIEFDDKLYDASVSKQLAELRKQFS